MNLISGNRALPRGGGGVLITMLLAISVTLGGQTDDGQTGQFALSLVQPPP